MSELSDHERIIRLERALLGACALISGYTQKVGVTEEIQKLLAVDLDAIALDVNEAIGK